MRLALRSLPFLVCALLLGCGDATPLITDTISPSPTVTLDAGQSITFTAKVQNDSTNSGVTWVVGSQGSLSSNTTSSVVYTAPATISATVNSYVQAIPVKNSLYAAATQIVLSPALAITSTTLAAGTLNKSYSATLTSTGGSGTATWSLAGGALPAGITLSSAGVLSGTPTVVGTFTFTAQVTDTATTPVAVTRSFTLSVTAPTLVLATTTLPNGISGTAYAQTLTATGGITPYTWTISSGSVPTGLALSSAGVLSGTPTVAGTFTFTAQVTDTETPAQTASRTFTVIIYSKLSITTATLPGGSLKNAYSQTLAASGNGTITWTLASGTLPPGLTLSTGGVLSGTPTAAGSYTFTVQATDSSVPQQTATAAYTVQIVTSTLAITTTTLANATVSAAYSATLTSTGGNAPVTWSLAPGSTLPAPLTLSSTGVLSGTPTTAGTYTFTVQATDSTPYTVSQTLTLQVVALATLSVSTTTLPAANLGTAYSTTLAATGGASPYTWSITSGTLPTGLALSSAGVLSGTPVAPGSYTFTVQVKDSQTTPATASRQFTLTVGTTLTAGTNNAELKGTYAFLLQGTRNGLAAGTAPGTATLGYFTADGLGTLTGLADTNASTGITTSAALTGTYTLGPDHRGLMVLTRSGTTTVLSFSTANFNGSIAQSVALSEFDSSAIAATANTTGFAKLQTLTTFSSASLNGTYVFGLSGDAASGSKIGPVVAVGTFTSNGTGTLSAGAEDAGAYGTSYNGVTFTGTYTVPSPTSSRGTLHVTNTGTLFAGAPTDYTFVLISSTELLLMSNNTHATSALLAGDAQLQTATTPSGTLIGYETQAANGDGSTTLPSTTAATLSRLAITGSGTATLQQDTDRAGTFTAGTAASTTFTTATNGRTTLGSQVLYLYSAGAGFALDAPTATTYPALATFEPQVAVAPYPPLLSGSFAAFTQPTDVPQTDSSGVFVWALSTGGVNSGLNGSVTSTLDTSTPTGALSLANSSSSLFTEDTTGRITLNASGSTGVTGVVYPISATRAVLVPTSSTTTPTVTILQK